MPWVEMITVNKESRNRELQCYESSSFLCIKISSTQLHDKAINSYKIYDEQGRQSKQVNNASDNNTLQRLYFLDLKCYAFKCVS